MTHSAKLKPFMAYLDVVQYSEFKRFSKRVNIPMSQLVREALTARLASGDQFTAGFNAGIKAAMDAVSRHDASRMRFPSGKSFEELINGEIKKELLNEETAIHRTAAGGTGPEGQSNQGMGNRQQGGDSATDLP